MGDSWRNLSSALKPLPAGGAAEEAWPSGEMKCCPKAGLGEMPSWAPRGSSCSGCQVLMCRKGCLGLQPKEKPNYASPLAPPPLCRSNLPSPLTPGSLLPHPHIPKAAPALWVSRGSGARSTQTTVRTTTVRTTPPAWTASTTTCVFAPPTTQVRPRRLSVGWRVWAVGLVCHA